MGGGRGVMCQIVNFRLRDMCDNTLVTFNQPVYQFDKNSSYCTSFIGLATKAFNEFFDKCLY